MRWGWNTSHSTNGLTHRSQPQVEPITTVVGSIVGWTHGITERHNSMQANKKPQTIEASITVYATCDLSELQEWFNDKVIDRDATDLFSLVSRYDEFLSIVGDDDTVREYLRNGGTVDDYSVDHEEYLDHCFDAFE